MRNGRTAPIVAVVDAFIVRSCLGVPDCTPVCNGAYADCTPVFNDRIVHAIDRPTGTSDDEWWIHDVATEVLGADPDAGIGTSRLPPESSAARSTATSRHARTSCSALTRRAVGEMLDVMRAVATPDRPATTVWGRRHRADLAARAPLPCARRPASRRVRAGDPRPARPGRRSARRLWSVAVRRTNRCSGRHLPAEVLAQVSWSAVFAIADHDLTRHDLGVRGATTSSLLLLGVPEHRAAELLDG